MNVKEALYHQVTLDDELSITLSQLFNYLHIATLLIFPITTLLKGIYFLP